MTQITPAETVTAAPLAEPLTGAALAKAILDKINAEPDRFDMSVWASRSADPDPEERSECGTSLCIAGWAVYLNGGRFVFRTDTQFVTDRVAQPDGVVVDIGTWAADLLGLDDCGEDEDGIDVFGLADDLARDWLTNRAGETT
jgi:hypothetical protein